MLIETMYWGKVEADYWRDGLGNEGLKPRSAVLPPVLIPSDLKQPAQWQGLMREGAKNYGKTDLAAKKERKQ